MASIVTITAIDDLVAHGDEDGSAKPTRLQGHQHDWDSTAADLHGGAFAVSPG